MGNTHWVSYENRRNSKTNGWKIQFQKLSFLKIFDNDKSVKSQICRTYKKLPKPSQAQSHKCVFHFFEKTGNDKNNEKYVQGSNCP